MGIGSSAPTTETVTSTGSETTLPLPPAVYTPSRPTPIGSADETSDTSKRYRSTLSHALSIGGLTVRVLTEIVISYAVPEPLTVCTIAGWDPGNEDGFGLECRLRYPSSAVFYRPSKSSAAPPCAAAAAVANPNRLCTAKDVAELDATIRLISNGGAASAADSDRKAERDEPGVLLLCDSYNSQLRIINVTTFDVRHWSPPLRYAAAITVDPSDNSLLVVEHQPVRIQRLVPHEQRVQFIAGRHFWDHTLVGADTSRYRDGPGADARFDAPESIACTSNGAACVVADTQNNRIRYIDLSTCEVSTFAGDGKEKNRDGIGHRSSVHHPSTVVFGESDAVVYVVAQWTIRRLNLRTRELTTLRVDSKLRWHPFTATFLRPNKLLIGTAESLYALNVESGELCWFAGGGSEGGCDGPSLRAKFCSPKSLVLGPKACADAADRLFVCDTYNHRIRLVSGSIFGVL